jgi:uncharacterized membrane protein
MSQRTSDEILEMARREIAARKMQATEERKTRDLPWRYAFFGLIGALLLGLIAWPGMPLDRKMYSAVHGVCAQIHNVQVGGLDLPLCARNTGIYSSFLITGVYLLALGRRRAAKLPPWPITIVLALFVVIMGVDGLNSMMLDMFMPHLYTPQNWLRTLTGIGMGISIAAVMLLILNVSLRRDPDTQQPIFASWLELGGALLINGLVWVAIYGNLGIMYWPVAIVAWLGITGVLYCVNLLLTALFMRYEGMVTHVAQLVKPASFALLFTLFELGALSAMRFWLEAQGLIVNG